MQDSSQTAAIDVWLSRGASLATIVAAVVAVGAIWYAHGQWREGQEARRQAERDRREAERPYVTIDLQSSASSLHILNFIIRNIGRTPAHAVKFSFDPPLQSAKENQQVRVEDCGVFREGIPFIPPGKVTKFFYESAIAVFGQKLPLTYRVAITYTDSNGEEYRDEAILDLEHIADTTVVTERTIHDVAEELKKIRSIFSRAKKGNGLRIYVIDSEKYDARVRESLAARRAQIAGSDSAPDHQDED